MLFYCHIEAVGVAQECIHCLGQSQCLALELQ